MDVDHREMPPDPCGVPPLQAVFDGAKHFGLTDDEVWRTICESLYEAAARDTTVLEYLDELPGVLARSILVKERRALASKGSGVACEERRVLSEELY